MTGDPQLLVYAAVSGGIALLFIVAAAFKSGRESKMDPCHAAEAGIEDQCRCPRGLGRAVFRHKER